MTWNVSSYCGMSTYMTYETGLVDYVDFPQTEDPVWILGKKYSTIYDLLELRSEIHSKLWFTYRKSFPNIGGTGPTSDQGWGCMLRCGQMVVAQALITRHLGRDWKLKPEILDPEYFRILKMFQDKKSSPYSIHQIALMGNSEGKGVGQWFGPNTVAQVLKKLAVYDEWSSLVIHVALDNTVVTDDIRRLCEGSTDEKDNFLRCRNNEDKISCWKPVLLFIPLRLGLSEINPIYVRGLKTTFLLQQSLGIIGGRPNHALYFIGFVGDEVVFLDPHTTQCAVDLDRDTDTSSYHCPAAGRMNILQLDPSIALCYFFPTETDFDNWCSQVHKLLILPEKQPLFELCKERPSHWPPLETTSAQSSNVALDFTLLDQDRQYDTSDEEFELL